MRQGSVKKSSGRRAQGTGHRVQGSRHRAQSAERRAEGRGRRAQSGEQMKHEASSGADFGLRILQNDV